MKKILELPNVTVICGETGEPKQGRLIPFPWVCTCGCVEGTMKSGCTCLCHKEEKNNEVD